MKTIPAILILLFFLTGCGLKTKSPGQSLREMREGFARGAEKYNARALAWENLVDSIYSMADTNSVAGIKTVDSLIINYFSIDREKVSALHFIKGDIYYRID